MGNGHITKDNDRIIRIFESTVRERLGTLRGSLLLVGISGGADSVALLRALVSIGADIECTHCNFGLRGEESDRDERFVADLCQRLGIKLHINHFDTQGYIVSHPGTSVEMACRELRYAWWDDLREETGAEAVVLAHHADDNIETMLINLFRGSGSTGLAGMPPSTSLTIRPLLDISRHDILRYLDALGQDFVTDSTNLTDDYRRNFIRNTLLPAVEERWPGVRTALRRTSRIMREENNIVNHALTQAVPSGSTFLPLDTIKTFPGTVTLLRHFLTPASPRGTQIEEIAAASSAGRLAGKHWDTPTHRIDGERDGIHIRPLPSGPVPVLPLRCTPIPNTPEVMERVTANPDPDTAWLPCPLSAYTARHPRKGDRIHPLGMKGSRLVSDMMKDAHLTAAAKERVTLLEDPGTGNIIWIKGLCRSRHHLVSPSCPTVYHIEPEPPTTEEADTNISKEKKR